MTTPTNTEKGKVSELKNLRPPFISLVGAGANRETSFVMVKTAETIKAVPDETVSDEDAATMRDQRSVTYGIEVLPTNTWMRYPAGGPTKEALYGDPVNLKYPFARDDNEVDDDRLRNALARFKQAYTFYQQEKSRRVIWSRIVEAALDAGIEVTYDPDSEVDGLLPQSITDRMEVKNKSADDAGDLGDWIESTSALLAKSQEGIDWKGRFEKAEKSARDLETELDTVRAENDALRRDLAKARESLRVAVAKSEQVVKSIVGTPTAMGRPSGATQQKKRVNKDAVKFFSGGDMAQEG